MQESATAPSSTTASREDAVDFKVYRPPQVAADVPESFFTPSAMDLKAAQASLSARTQALVNAPLRTEAMREAEQKMRMQRFPTTAIRVKFADRTLLEKTFPSSDKIRAVYAFVRNSLREDVKPIKFVLYQTPPKRELKVSDSTVRDLTLFQLQLAPASVLHLKFENDDFNRESNFVHRTVPSSLNKFTDIDVPAPLDPSILVRAEDLPLPPQPDDQPRPGPTTNKSTTKSSTSGSSSGTKVPRWLKLGPSGYSLDA